ncbi:MAG: lysozyme inhibitor LprI family protein [Pseudorhodoplanes sp.]
MLLFLVFFSLAAGAGPVFAQRAGADAQNLAACLKKASDQGEFGANCIGIVADPCIANAMKQKSYWEDSKACANREFAIWNDLMGRALRAIEKAGGKDIKPIVAEAQKSFLQSRDKLCPIFDGLDPGMAPGGANYCRLQETARRVLSLQRLAAALGQH